MKRIRCIAAAFLIVILAITAGCAGKDSTDQTAELAKEIAALRNSLAATNQELASTKQALQQLQTINSSTQYQAATKVKSSVPVVTRVSSSVPVIVSFTASPSTIQAGQQSILQWCVNGADSVYINQGIGTVPSSGTRAVYPSSTTKYVLTATGYGTSETVTASVTVQVYCYPNSSSCYDCTSPCYYFYRQPCYPAVRYPRPIYKPSPPPPPPPHPFPKPPPPWGPMPPPMPPPGPPPPPPQPTL